MRSGGETFSPLGRAAREAGPVCGLGIMPANAYIPAGIFHNAGKADKSHHFPTKADNAVGFAITPSWAGKAGIVA